MKMKQYYTVEKFGKGEYDMILGPVSEAEAYNCMREFEESYPSRIFGIVSHSIEVEDSDY